MYFLPNSKYTHQDFKTADSHNQASLPIHCSEMVKQVCTETGLLTLKAVDANSKGLATLYMLFFFSAAI